MTSGCDFSSCTIRPRAFGRLLTQISLSPIPSLSLPPSIVRRSSSSPLLSSSCRLESPSSMLSRVSLLCRGHRHRCRRLSSNTSIFPLFFPSNRRPDSSWKKSPCGIQDSTRRSNPRLFLIIRLHLSLRSSFHPAFLQAPPVHRRRCPTTASSVTTKTVAATTGHDEEGTSPRAGRRTERARQR
jgi:hypothetical protein